MERFRLSELDYNKIYLAKYCFNSKRIIFQPFKPLSIKVIPPYNNKVLMGMTLDGKPNKVNIVGEFIIGIKNINKKWFEKTIKENQRIINQLNSENDLLELGCSNLL